VSLVAYFFLAALVVHVVTSVILHRTNAQTQGGREGAFLVAPVWPFVLVFWKVIYTRNLSAFLSATFQSLLFVGGCYLGYQEGIFSRDLISPVWIGVGLLAGHAIFGMSLLATHHSLHDARQHLSNVRGVWDYIVENPQVLMQFLSVSIGEEIIYRVGGQPLAISLFGGRAALGIVAVAIGFSLVHEHFFRNDFSQSAEFLVFSLVLGVLYYVTGSLVLVIVIHAVRNIEIAMLEHEARVEETGSEGTAERTEALLSGHDLLVMVGCPPCGVDTACFSYASQPDMRPELRHQLEKV